MWTSSLACLLLTFGVADAAPEAKPPLEIRVGLLAYEDFRADLQYYDRLFAELTANSDVPVRFRLTSGTYGDVLHWLARDRIDVAIVTPGILAAGLTGDEGGPAARGYSYLATHTVPPAVSELALPDRRQPGRHTRCRSVCVVAQASRFRTGDDLRQAQRQGKVQFLFVDPLSVSGRIAPEYALQQLSIEPRPEQISFTFSHSNSLRRLGDEPASVAFVWDDALRAAPEAALQVRRLPLPELDKLWMPVEVVVGRRGFEQAELVRALLTGLRPDEFTYLADWPTHFRPVRQWIEALRLPAEVPAVQQIPLPTLGEILLHYGRSQPRPPRLALVLSGGGAKCAYQVGAVWALEEELARLRQEHPQEAGLDIALVVGTSGGAINAVPMALGITSSAAGRADFGNTWKQMDQRTIVRPPRLVRANIGLWFALFQTGLVVWWTRRKHPDDARRRDRQRWQALVTLGLLEIALGYLPWAPWSLLGNHHLLHHAWLWCTFGIHGSAWCLLTVGAAALAARRLPARFQPHWTWPRRWLAAVFWVGLLGLPVIQVLTVLFYEETLSEGTGIARVLGQQFARLVDAQVARDGLPPLELGSPRDDREQLQAVSRQIIERHLLKRDLVLTGSCLAQSSQELPLDLYFYAAAEASRPPPPLGPRGIALAERPDLLLDVVMGSGSIYPMFPPRRLADFPRAGEFTDLVDGGFAHNSPIEAAVLWGATHIVLIQASPEERVFRRNFWENVTAAFNHLYDQAQRVDVQSKEQVTVFTLTPQAPHLCVLDFADNLIDLAIVKGYREARGERRVGQPGEPRFRKELGEPTFWVPR